MNFYNGVLTKTMRYFTLGLYFMERVANRDKRKDKSFPTLKFNQTIEN